MAGHGAKFGRRKEAAVAALLIHRSIEEAARSAGIGAQTLLRWMKIPEFDQAYREARRADSAQATARLQHATGAAASTLMRIMMDANVPASTRLRAADSILNHARHATEIEDIEVRVAALERTAESSKQSARRDGNPAWTNFER